MTMLLAALAVASCQSDDASADSVGQPIHVKLSLGAAKSPATRASWTDTNAADGEMMKQWLVVAVQDGKVAAIAESNIASGEEKEHDEAEMDLLTGSVTFYSFANLTKADLGLGSIKIGDALPADFDAKTVAVAGNKDAVSQFANGIPMANKQTVSITNDYRNGIDQQGNAKYVELEVVRLVAKVSVKLQNATTSDLTVKSVALNDITTDGTAAAPNLYLLPTIQGDTVAPRLAPNAPSADRPYTFATAQTVEANKANTVVATFYANESLAAKPHYFVLTVTLTDGSQQRFAMLTYNHISRNDYIVIPVTLNDYKVTMDAEQFTAIGLLPEVTEEPGKLTVTFGTYGEFHLRPHVYNRNNTEQAATQYTVSSWKIIEGDEAIYEEAPAYEAATNLFEGYMGTKAGYAIHQLTVNIGGTNIPFKVEIRKK